MKPSPASMAWSIASAAGPVVTYRPAHLVALGRLIGGMRNSLRTAPPPTLLEAAVFAPRRCDAAARQLSRITHRTPALRFERACRGQGPWRQRIEAVRASCRIIAGPPRVANAGAINDLARRRRPWNAPQRPGISCSVPVCW